MSQGMNASLLPEEGRIGQPQQTCRDDGQFVQNIHQLGLGDIGIATTIQQTLDVRRQYRKLLQSLNFLSCAVIGHGKSIPESKNSIALHL
ncbi:MAG: hypothetical protein A2061_02370 [Gallionellales bacterium GWA2_59_43]|nr:MAG: hypothetical protein A2061_02370 [Gallionellales bacterium GWA2_59_43]